MYYISQRPVRPRRRAPGAPRGHLRPGIVVRVRRPRRLGSGGERPGDWLLRVRVPPPDGDNRRRSCYLRRRGRVRPALAPALERNMYRFRSQLFTGISAAASAHSYPRRFSPLLLAEASPLSRPPHRRTSKKCSSIG
ncbi:uncharacterized protein WM277_019522 [Molossus nigricans]